MLRMDSECATCETRQGSAQSAMTQAKKQAVNHSMEQAIKQSVRELACWCHNTVQDQHSKANSSCCVFTRSNREQMGRAVTPRNPSKIHRLVDHRSNFAPRDTCPGRCCSASVKVSCGGAGPEKQRRSGRPLHKTIGFIPSGERESQRRSHRARPSGSCPDSFHKSGTPDILNKCS